MGTRADFYIGRGKTAEWLGSIAWDGHPSGINHDVLWAATLPEYKAAIKTFLAGRNDDATLPEQGWPWPWEDSCTTDYAYAFDDGKVYASCFGRGWWLSTDIESDDDTAEEKTCVFPNMKDKQNVTLGKRSGVIVLAL